MLESIITYVKKKYDWSDQYVKAVIFEYERFLYIKSLDTVFLPPDPINKLWNIHILYTEDYYNYCMEKFNKLIHYIPDMILDHKDKQLNISKTLKMYIKTYSSVKYPKIWNINTELINLPVPFMLGYKPKRQDILDKESCKNIKIKIVYILDKQITKDLIYDNQTLNISISPNMTFKDLINFISRKISYPCVRINIYSTDNRFNKVNKSNNINLDDKINPDLFKYYIFELDLTI